MTDQNRVTPTFLLMAASRDGANNVVARLQNKSHKCLIQLGGELMIVRVLREIMASERAGRIYVSIEDESILSAVPECQEWLASGRISTVQSRENLFLSVMSAVKEIENPYPLVISTADNALHTAPMVRHFVDSLFAQALDAGLGMTNAKVILEAYPDGQRPFYRMKGDNWSGCNIYGLMTERAVKMSKAFEGGGQFGKYPWRVMKAFGLMNMIYYKFQLKTLEQAMESLSRRFKMKVMAIDMPFADGPIDVDNPGDVVLTEKILAARKQSLAD
jgi:GTP:adenosylcobinamide-phosphate guanylyltransferase